MVVVERKISGGKLVRIQAHFNRNIIAFVRITGDFFMHPEDAITRIEKNLTGKNISLIEVIVDKSLHGVECIGFSKSDICSMLKEAYSLENGPEIKEVGKV
ncbi:MAG: lipoate protein ligase C-terminal domain-containing protein [Candidatus Micrarchaeia archaeon]